MGEDLVATIARIIREVKDEVFAAQLIVQLVPKHLGRTGGRPILPEEERFVRQDVPTSVRFRVFERDGFKCRYCGRSREGGATLVVDHVIPVARGGRNTVGNLV